MAQPWWQRLTKSKSQPLNLKPHPHSRVWSSGFEVYDSTSDGWWLRAESKPVRVGLVAAAKAVPALLMAWTFNAAPPVEPRLPRGADRLALLSEWGLKFAA